MLQQRGNLAPRERWISVLSGIGLALASLTRGTTAIRSLGAIAGLSLIARGAAGHCAMKAALAGETSLREGVRDQWARMRSSALRARGIATAARDIDTMEALYTAEVQELHSAESQLCALLRDLPEAVPNLSLERELRGYGTEIRTRREDLERILLGDGVNPRQHPDQAMQALLTETRKMAQVAAKNVRSAALVASLQRILHYKIAGYGTVATYAKTLGRVDEASRLAEYADRDKALDQQLSSIAKDLVGDQARARPEGVEQAAPARPH